MSQELEFSEIFQPVFTSVSMKTYAVAPVLLKNAFLNQALIILRSINTLMGRLCICNEYKWLCASALWTETIRKTVLLMTSNQNVIGSQHEGSCRLLHTENNCKRTSENSKMKRKILRAFRCSSCCLAGPNELWNLYWKYLRNALPSNSKYRNQSF